MTVGLLIIGSLLLGCAAREPSPTALAPTPMSSVVPTASPKPSSTPSFTKTPILDSKPTITATIKSLAIPLPLSGAILTSGEVIEQYPSLEGYFGGTTDITDELLAGNNCLLECVKHVWSAGQYGPRHLIITMIKSDSSSKAEKLVEETREMFIDINDLSDRSTLAYLPKNAWAAYYYPRQEFVLNYSYGQVFVLVVSQPNEGFDDFAGEFDLISLVSRLQMDKLNASGYTH